MAGRRACGAAGEDGAPNGSCDLGCVPEPQSAFCEAGERSWRCDTLQFDKPLFDAACTDAATGAIRYCCPLAFKSECQ